MTPLDMYDGYAAGVLVSNPQKRREKVAAIQIEELEKDVERLQARILELEEALAATPGEGLVSEVPGGPYVITDTDDPTDYAEDNEPGDDASTSDRNSIPAMEHPPEAGVPQGPDEGDAA